MFQAMVEDLLKEYPNVLILRRMPIVADLTYPRNFITKIIKYDKVLMSELWYIAAAVRLVVHQNCQYNI